MNWQRQKRVLATLYSLQKEGKLSFQQAHKMLSTSKTLPKVYEDLMNVYIETHDA